jgi:hypothetical protein
MECTVCNPVKTYNNQQGAAGPSVEVYGPNGQQQMGQQQRTAFYQGVLPPLASSQPMEWHASITPDLRKHLTLKLFRVSSNFVWIWMKYGN